MKTVRFIYPVLVLMIVTISTVYSQTDTAAVYYTKGISIDYLIGTRDKVNFEMHITTKVPEYESIEDINKIKILNDSMINISNDNRSNVQLNMNKIGCVSIRSGSKMGMGIWLGLLSGLGIGYLIGSANDNNVYPKNGFMYVSPTVAGVLIGIPVGALIGGVTGSFFSGYDDYELDYSGLNKKESLERILETEKKSK